MSRRGDFFAVGKPQWKAACELGMNPAVALLVLARGTGADNSTTAWSAEAISKYSGITWRRSKSAVTVLCEHELAICTAFGKHPRYKLAKPDDMEDLIWLPNEIVTGAANETPPVARIRQTQEIEVLQLFVDLYGEQELAGDGGLPRRLIYQHFEREKIMDMGQFTVYGFNRPDKGTRWCRNAGPLARFSKRKEGKGTAWERLEVVERLGLLEWVHYLAESTDDDAELIHALSGDEHALTVAEAASELVSALPGGFSYEAQNYDYVLPVIRHMEKAAVVGLSRLRYRPKTSRTATWYGQHVESCRKFAALYSNLARGEFKQAV
jgi:hypothetical protein